MILVLFFKTKIMLLNLVFLNSYHMMPLKGCLYYAPGDMYACTYVCIF